MSTLSKSLYIRGLQCTKSLWLKKYKKDVLTPPNEFAQAIFATGNRVGEEACKLFSNAQKIPYDNTSFEEKRALTKKWIDEGVANIYEATFEYDGVLVMVDILHKKSDESFEIYEVKSSSWNDKKKLKEIEKYIHDASIQYYVLKGLGYNLSKCFITMLNSDYVCDGNLDIEKLFIHVDVTKEVQELQSDIPTYLRTFEKFLDDRKNEPQKEIGEHCFKPHTCDGYDYCWKKQLRIPEFSMFNVFNKGNTLKKKFRLFSEGITDPADIPQDAITSEDQHIVIECYKNKSRYINKERIQKFLDISSYPIYHLDFETYTSPIPEFKNQRPYQQIPFQYSLHIERENGTLEHKEFLGLEGTDPREELIQQMIKDIPSQSCVLVYNKSFEEARIKELANDFPEHSEKLLGLLNNMVDLAVPFEKKYYYDHTLNGRYSIKLVMPLMAPHMADAYKKLSLVQNGGDAMNTFPKLMEMDESDRLKYREALLEYCKLDTLAMVEVLKKLRESVV